MRLVVTRRGRITKDEWPRICDNLKALPIDIDVQSYERVPDTVLPMANEHYLSVYDAMYLELALRLKLPLATLDRKLRKAGKTAGIELI